MFGCSEHWIGKRFSHGLTTFLTSEKQRRAVSAHDALDRDAFEGRYEAWREQRARDAALGVDASLMAPGDGGAGGFGGGRGGDGNGTGGDGAGGDGPGGDPYPWTTTTPRVQLGRTWTIPSTHETVDLGRFDPTRAPIVTIESGDVLRYVDTWTHFLGALQPGVPIETLAALRLRNRGRGVHSIIGPIAVRGAKPGDLLEVRFLDLRTIDFGANFHMRARSARGRCSTSSRLDTSSISTCMARTDTLNSRRTSNSSRGRFKARSALRRRGRMPSVRSRRADTPVTSTSRR